MASYIVKYKGFYSSVNTSKGYTHIGVASYFYKYQWIWVWNPKTEEFALYLGNMNYYFDYLSDTPITETIREAMSCALFALYNNRTINKMLR